MSFETDTPKHLAELRIKWTSLNFEKQDMFHDCGCEYCDYDGLKDDYTDDDVAQVTAAAKEVEKTFTRVKRHAEAAGIDVSDTVISSWERKLRGLS